MILLKKRLALSDRIAVSSEHHWKIGTYLKTQKGTFVYVHKIIIYDQEKNKEICEFPYFKDLEDKVNEIKLGYNTNAEALIMGSTKKYLLLKRKTKKFDGEIFYIGKKQYNLYIPKDFFIFLDKKTVTEVLPTLKKIKREYTLQLIDYPDFVFTGEKVLEIINLIKNKEFIDDFFKVLNFKNKPSWGLSPATLFDSLNDGVKKDILQNLKKFIEKYDSFEVEG